MLLDKTCRRSNIHKWLFNTPIWCISNIEVNGMKIHEMRKALGLTQSEFTSRYNIPFQTFQNWEEGKNNPPKYVLSLLEEKVKSDLVNRKSNTIPKYDPNKLDLPDRKDFKATIFWLHAVKKCLGNNFVFALDEALMCHGLFLGRYDELLIWGYGDDSNLKYNGVVLLGNNIDDMYVIENHGLKFTNLNRTIEDALANEDILDMQGITEGLSDYYYDNDETFDGIYVQPKYATRFHELSKDAIEYYDS